MAMTPALYVGRDQVQLVWDPAIPPIATVASGAIVELDLLDASNGQITASSTLEDLGRVDFDRVDPLHGPIAVTGTEPGDTLQIDLLEFVPADWGWTAGFPGFGLLGDEFPDPALRITHRSATGERAEFLPGIRVPVHPFCGVIGVAPPKGPLPTVPPGAFGRNLDTRHLTAGATLFLPVFQLGACLSMGDSHAAQGDGEVCGTAIETPMRATVRLTARKGLHLVGPEFLTPDAPAVRGGDGMQPTGSGPT
jgi:acetamidase/formamidase